jgi:hypothetical protein
MKGCDPPGFEIQGNGFIQRTPRSSDIRGDLSAPDRFPDRHFGHGPSIAAQMS